MTRLVAEALDLDPSALTKYFYEDTPRNKISVVRYCVPEELPKVAGKADAYREDGSFQGVGPHKDGSFLIYLLQMTEHVGLEVQNKSGMWIRVPPVPGTLVVNVGRSLESMTRGVCSATTHRVNLRSDSFYDDHGRFLGPRYSCPVFQNLRPDVTKEELTSLQLPRHISDLVTDEKVRSDAEAYVDKVFGESLGKANFIARVTSHPEVGRKWYPDFTEKVLKEQREFAA